MTDDKKQSTPAPSRSQPWQFTLRALLALITLCAFTLAIAKGVGIGAVLLFLLGVGIAVRKTRTAAILIAVSFVVLPGALFVLLAVSSWLALAWVVLLALAFWWADYEYRQKRQKGTAAPSRQEMSESEH